MRFKKPRRRCPKCLDKKISRRSLLSKSGALVVGFSFAPAIASFLTTATPAAASPITDDPDQVDSWLTIDTDSGVTVYSGKVELGTGVETALSQIVADELYLDFPGIVGFVQGDTSLTPNQGYTAGSNTIYAGGVQLRQAAATAFQHLLQLASDYFTSQAIPFTTLVAQGGYIYTDSSMTTGVSYGDLIGGQQINLAVDTGVTVRDPNTYAVVGQSVQRVDLPGKVFGTFSYVQDVVVPGMLHGRVVRPAGRNATYSGHDSLPTDLVGSPQVVVNQDFVGVVATDEWAAIQAAKQLNVTWNPGPPLAATDDGTATARNGLISALQDPDNIFDVRPVGTPAGNVASGLASANKTLQATYFTPYQMHAAIGPSCAVADVKSDPIRSQGFRPRSGPERRASISCRAQSPSCSDWTPLLCT